MKITSVRCKTCGGEVNIESRFAKTIVCRYCNTVYLLENDAISEVGVTKPFEPVSILRVGATGLLDNKPLQVLGRIRLQDDEDLWDEWYVFIDNRPFWIEESSDSILLLSSTSLTKPIGHYSEIQVGQVIDIDNIQVFVTEKGQAKVIGLEGEFTGRVKPNDDYKFVQGNAENEIYMVEYYTNEIKTFKGRILNLDKISIKE